MRKLFTRELPLSRLNNSLNTGAKEALPCDSKCNRKTKKVHGLQINTLGNTSLLNPRKVAFLCSRKCPAAGKYVTVLSLNLRITL